MTPHLRIAGVCAMSWIAALPACRRELSPRSFQAASVHLTCWPIGRGVQWLKSFWALLGIFLCTLALSTARWRARDGFIEYVASPSGAPHVVGDFDEDGRPDSAAVVPDGADRSFIEISLVASTEIGHVDAKVTTLVEVDVDDDGDLDLVGATRSGDLLIWLNDGHGYFTRQPAASRTSNITTEAAISAEVRDAAMVSITVVPLESRRTVDVVAIAARVLQRSKSRISVFAFGLLPPFRAPPA